jgi:hypothetical protein
MKAKRSRDLKARLLGGLLVGGMLAGATPLLAATAEVSAPVQDAPKSAVRYPSGVADVVKMLDAKVDEKVIKAYVQNSPVAYSLNADEIIALKRHGVPDDVVAAMLARGAEVRAQAAKVSPAGGSPAASSAYPYAPAPASGYDYPYSYGTQPVYSDYGPYYPDYAYPSYGYGWYGYPWFYSWPFFVGFDGYRHFRDFDRFGRFHGVDRGLRTFNRSGTFASSRSQAFAPANGFGRHPTFVAGHNFSAGRPGFANHSGFGGRGGGGGGRH